MKINFTRIDKVAFTILDVPEDCPVELAKMLIENDMRIPAEIQVLWFHDKALPNDSTLADHDVKDASTLIVSDNTVTSSDVKPPVSQAEEAATSLSSAQDSAVRVGGQDIPAVSPPPQDSQLPEAQPHTLNPSSHLSPLPATQELSEPPQPISSSSSTGVASNPSMNDLRQLACLLGQLSQQGIFSGGGPPSTGATPQPSLWPANGSNSSSTSSGMGAINPPPPVESQQLGESNPSSSSNPLLTLGNLFQRVAPQLENNPELGGRLRNYAGSESDFHLDDPATQHMIESRIRADRIDENFMMAQEYLPESFGVIVMLYINVEINGKKVTAFVDSGAQRTIMAKSCAQRCNLLNLIDTRFQGTAVGVGSAEINGKIHIIPIKIGKSFYQASLIILQSNMTDLILGLDFLRGHLCSIDIGRNVLAIGDNEVPFLSETEISSSLRESTM